jgi:parallel beta-helix repeat protein
LFESLETRRLLTADPRYLLDDIDGETGFYVRDSRAVSGVDFRSLGDVNHDGFDDLGYTQDGDDGSEQGLLESGIIFGHANTSPVINVDQLDGSQKLIIRDSRDAILPDYVQIRGLGDINGDGIDDFGVLSNWQELAQPDESLYGLFIVHGRADGRFGNDGVLDLQNFSSSDGSILYTGPLGTPRTHIDDFVAGDIDGDGFSDLHVVWSDNTEEFHPKTTKTWVDTYYGFEGGFPAVSRLDQTPRHRYIADKYQFLGYGFVWKDQGIDFGGDINGDGRPDLAIGGYSLVTRQEPIYVVFGGTRPVTKGTDLDLMSPSQGLRILSENSLGSEGLDLVGGALAFVGDVTDDGVDDLVINKFQGTDPLRQGSGGVFLVKGRCDGWESGVVDLAHASPREVTKFYGVIRRSGRNYFGSGPVTSVSAVGDLNGDGIDDLVFVATLDRWRSNDQYINAYEYSGVYVVFGGAHLANAGEIPRPDIAGTLGLRLELNGFSALNFVDGGFDFDGDGNNDLLLTDQCPVHCLGFPSNVARVLLDPFGIGRQSGPEIAVSITNDSGGGSVSSGTGVVSFGDPYVNYRSVSGIRSFEVTNRGSEDLIVQPAEIDAGSGFSITANLAPNTRLLPGQSAIVTVAMATDTLGDRKATLSIPNNDANENPFEINLFGQVQDAAKAQLAVGPVVLADEGARLDWGSVPQSFIGVTKEITITNVGTLDLRLSPASLGNSLSFSVVQNVTSNQIVQPGQTATLLVRMNAASSGEKTATLQFNGVSVELIGNVVRADPPPQLLSLQLAASTLAEATDVQFTATFSESVTGVDASDFLAMTTGTVTTGPITVQHAGSDVYTVTVTQVAGIGSLRLRLVDDGTIHDSALQRLTGSLLTSAPQTVAVGEGPFVLRVDDFDGDGHTDMVTANNLSKSVTILRSLGNGTFAAPQNIATPAPPLGLYLGDFNEDGIVDLLVPMANGTAAILKGNGDATFTLFASPAMIGVIRGVADIDQDGHLDLLYGSFTTSAQVGWLKGNGDGTFVNSGARSVVSIQTVGVADLGGIKIVAAGGTAGTAFLTSLVTSVPLVFGQPVTNLTLADVDLDDQLDLIYTSSALNRVVVKSRITGAETIYDVAEAPSGVMVSDVNNDGIPDVLTTHPQTNVVTVLFGVGDGSFQSAVTLDIGVNPVDVQTLDIDGDGRQDVVAVNRSESQVTAVLGTGQFSGKTAIIGEPEIEVLDENGDLLSVAASFEFGNTQTNQASPTRTVTVRNLSTSNLLVQPAQRVSGAGFDVLQNFQSNQVIGPGGEAQLVFGLNTATAGVQQAVITFGTNDTDEPAFELSLTGSVIAPLEINVTTTANSGPGSLRQAILDANLAMNEATIRFAIPETDPGFVDVDADSGLPGADAAPDVFRIKLTTNLPAINNIHGQPVTMTGVPASDTNPNGPEIVIDGSLVTGNGYGLTIQSDMVTVASVGLESFSTWGILAHGTNATIKGAYIGIDATGTRATGAARGIETKKAGITVIDSVISGHSAINAAIEVLYGSDDLRLIDNRIGTNAAGTATVPNAGAGVKIASSARAVIQGNTVSGNTGSGIELSGSLTVGTVIQGNVIGLSADGRALLPNSGIAGIALLDAVPDVQIGGGNSGEGNLISGNLGEGIFLDGYANLTASIVGNTIGTDITGQLALGNQGTGIRFGTKSTTAEFVGTIADNLVSGNGRLGIELSPSVVSATVERNQVGTNREGSVAVGNGTGGIQVSGNSVQLNQNVVSGNVGFGISVGGGATATQIQSNRIGTNSTATATIPNRGPGLRLTNAYQATIGSNTPQTGNVISGNEGPGILIDSISPTAHVVEGNWIGTDPTGLLNFGNGGAGIVIGGQGNVVEGNSIFFNLGVGIDVAWFQTRIVGNRIAGNSGLGIDLNSDGFSVNDLLDADLGPNGGQNSPVILDVVLEASDTVITGSFGGKPNATFTLHVYDNVASRAAQAQGQTLLETRSVTTDSQGNATFSITVPQSLGIGHFVSATATDAGGNISEFAPGVGAAILKLTIDVTSISELGVAAATVSRNTSTIGSLSVIVSGSDPTEVSLPAVVTIPAGSDSVTFAISGVRDLLIDGTQTLSISVDADGFMGDAKPIAVTDVDPDGELPASPFTISSALATLAENGQVTVTLVADPASVAREIKVSFSADARLSIPQTLIFPGGASQFAFLISATDDLLLQGDKPISVAFQLVGFAPLEANFLLLDDEAEFPFTNPSDPLDVNGDGAISPLDVLIIINAMNSNRGGALVWDGIQQPAAFYDPSRSNSLEPLDALLIINYLNQNAASGEGPIAAVDEMRKRCFLTPRQVELAFSDQEVNWMTA